MFKEAREYRGLAACGETLPALEWRSRVGPLRASAVLRVPAHESANGLTRCAGRFAAPSGSSAEPDSRGRQTRLGTWPGGLRKVAFAR